MDGLSIASFVLALLDTALKIKAWIDKLGQYRRRLRDLSGDIVQDLTKLQRFCNVNRLDLRESPELEESLRDLQRDLLRALSGCERMLPPGGKGLIGRIHGAFRYWKVADDIEEDLRRLKDNLQTNIVWTCLYGVVRSEMAANTREHKILVSQSEEQWRLHRFDATFGETIGQNRSCELSMLLEHSEPRDVDRQYLRFKVQSIAQSLESLKVSLNQATAFSFKLSDYIPSRTSDPSTEVTTVITSTVQVWQIIGSLREANASDIYDWLQPALVLADQVLAYGFEDLSYRIFCSGARMLEESLRRAPSNCEGTDTLLLFYTWALMRQSVICTHGFKKLEIIWKMVGIRYRLYQSSSSAYSKSQRLTWLCRALTELATTYHWIGEVDDALSCCERALRLTHPSNYSDCPAADWTQLEIISTPDASWTVTVGDSHPVSQALGYGLMLYAKLLQAKGRYGAAWHAGYNSVLVVQSLQNHVAQLPEDFHFFDWHMKWLRGSMHSWTEVPRNLDFEEEFGHDDVVSTSHLLTYGVGRAI